MATRFMDKALATTALGTALSLLLAATTAPSPAWADPPAPPQLNPFAGSWSGPYIDTIPGSIRGGTMTWTISDAGVTTGTWRNTTVGSPLYGLGGTMVGHVNANGNFLLITITRGDGGGYPCAGTAVIVGDTLTATYTTLWSESQGLSYTIVATLERD